MLQLGVNIDHVATVRQARRTYEPDPAWAAAEAQLGGADVITVHLREDRRHIQDHDVERIAKLCHVKLNLEMAATDEMVDICCRIKPRMATLVPEGRMEITTEGGLDVAAQQPLLRDVVKRLNDAGITASAFIEADKQQVEAAAACGFSMCEVHTGPYAHLFHQCKGDLRDQQLEKQIRLIADAGRCIVDAGMQFNAGHALTYVNVQPVAALANMNELHIGHSIISRAVFTGLRSAVAQMKSLIIEAKARTDIPLPQ